MSATESLHFEVKQKQGASGHVSVHCLCPGVVATNIQGNANKLMERELHHEGAEEPCLHEAVPGEERLRSRLLASPCLMPSARE